MVGIKLTSSIRIGRASMIGQTGVTVTRYAGPDVAEVAPVTAPSPGQKSQLEKAWRLPSTS